MNNCRSRFEYIDYYRTYIWSNIKILKRDHSNFQLESDWFLVATIKILSFESYNFSEIILSKKKKKRIKF